jgi:hypothetical protein
MLASDYQTAVWLSVPIIVWFMYLIVPFFRLSMFTYMCAGFTVLCIGLWVRHWFKVRALLATGEVVTARIKTVDFERTRGRVALSFSLDEQGYAQTLTVARSKQTEALKASQDVRLIVDRKDLEHALLLDLYLRPPRPTL